MAAYFNISIDELMSYSPQMTSEDIKRLYQKLSEAFSKKPFDEVYAECNTIIKKYYSCFLLLLQMAVLLTNHYMLAPEKETQEKIIQQIIDLCIRIQSESGDSRLSEQATGIQGLCLLMQNKPSEVVDLLAHTEVFFRSDTDTLLANAYFALGKTDHAKTVLQKGIYDRIMAVINIAPVLVLTDNGSPEKIEGMIKRMFAFAELFQIESLNPNGVLLLCLSAAQYYVTQEDADKALLYLDRYASACCAVVFPLKLHGDDFFDCIDGELEKLDLGTMAPRDGKVIKRSMVEAITQNPAFTVLADRPQFKRITDKLKQNAGGEENE